MCFAPNARFVRPSALNLLIQAVVPSRFGPIAAMGMALRSPFGLDISLVRASGVVSTGGMVLVPFRLWCGHQLLEVSALADASWFRRSGLALSCLHVRAFDLRIVVRWS